MSFLVSQLVKNPPAIQETLVQFLVQKEGIRYPLQNSWAFLVAQMVNNLNLHAMQEIWVQSLGWEDSLEKGTATHSSTVAWRIPWTVYTWDHKESDMTERFSLSLFILNSIFHITSFFLMAAQFFVRMYHYLFP